MASHDEMMLKSNREKPSGLWGRDVCFGECCIQDDKERETEVEIFGETVYNFGLSGIDSRCVNRHHRNES